jgi:Carboxypeptidase regulatory-like domain
MKKTKSSGSPRVVVRGRLRCEDGRSAHDRETVRPTRAWAVLWFGALVLIASISMAKQKPPATRTISGQVLNGSNQGISGASVLLTDMQTHKTNAIYSGSGGNYNFSGLNAYHDYEIRARYQRMTSETREVSSMDPRLQIVVNLTLSPESPHEQ